MFVLNMIGNHWYFTSGINTAHAAMVWLVWRTCTHLTVPKSLSCINKILTDDGYCLCANKARTINNLGCAVSNQFCCDCGGLSPVRDTLDWFVWIINNGWIVSINQNESKELDPSYAMMSTILAGSVFPCLHCFDVDTACFVNILMFQVKSYQSSYWL